jgi:hypothetical protein
MYFVSVKKFRTFDGTRISSSRSKDPATRPYTPLNILTNFMAQMYSVVK